MPVRVKKTRQNKSWSPSDFIRIGKALTLPHREFCELMRHRAVDVAAERHHEFGDAIELFPAPLVEFRRLAVARGEWIDLLLGAGKTQRKPFLPLAAKLRQPVRWSARIGRKLVTQPIGLAEIVGAFHAGLFPELAHHRLARVFLPVDSALRHLPLEARENDLRAVVPESPSDQDLARGIE